jgi:Tfx family DNA-binding protein
MRKRGYSYSEIGKRLGVSKQNVHSIEKRARRQFEECKLAYELLHWAFAKDCILVDNHKDLREVIKNILEIGDKHNIKIVGTVDEILGFVKVRLGNKIEKDFAICVMVDGRIEVVGPQTLEYLRQQKLVDIKENI